MPLHLTQWTYLLTPLTMKLRVRRYNFQSRPLFRLLERWTILNAHLPVNFLAAPVTSHENTPAKSIWLFIPVLQRPDSLAQCQGARNISLASMTACATRLGNMVSPVRGVALYAKDSSLPAIHWTDTSARNTVANEDSCDFESTR